VPLVVQLSQATQKLGWLSLEVIPYVGMAVISLAIVAWALWYSRRGAFKFES